MDEPFIINVADARAGGRPRRAISIELEPDGVHWPSIIKLVLLS
jgi:hypothetical protein